jgi:hypothetical protein
MEPHEIQRMNALIQKVDLLERQLAFVMKHVGVQFRDDRPAPDEIEQKVIAGDRLGAIKLLTQRGLDLAAAKRAVDDIAARLGL